MPDINLNDMSPDELKQLRKDLDKAIENYDVRRKQDARAAAEAKAREMGFSLSELVDGSAKKGKTPKPPKYRHPENPSLTWSGRGRQPDWIKEALENGRSKDEFLIEPTS